MSILTFDLSWMIYNLSLAFLAVGFGYLFLRIEGKWLQLLFGILWFLFLPNTIYIFTDLEHFVYEWHNVLPSLQPLFSLQYALFECIGIVTYFLSMLPFEKYLLNMKRFKSNKVNALIVFNFLIAFGMVLGRVERINSWEVVTDPLQVITSALHVLTSIELLGLTLLFGLLCNFIYFLFRKKVLYYARKLG